MNHINYYYYYYISFECVIDEINKRMNETTYFKP